MRITVVTPTHNKLHLLRRTLASLAGQDVGPGAFEVVVVDDGSTDGTAGLVAAHPDPRVQLVTAPSPGPGWRVTKPSLGQFWIIRSRDST